MKSFVVERFCDVMQGVSCAWMFDTKFDTVLPLLQLQSSGQNAKSGILRKRFGVRAMVLCFVALLASVPSLAVTKAASARRSRHAAITHAHRSLRFIRWNPMFPGSHDLLVQQNVELDRLQLPRIADDFELARYESSQDLVPVSESQALKIAEVLPDNRRYCRPWTRDFLENFSQAFYSEFRSPIQVNSLVRTAEQQRKLRRHNRFAAPESGDTASTHLTGVTVDLSRRGLTKAQYEWVRSYLMPLKEAGLVDPIEERQPVLHVVVFDKYSEHLIDTKGWSEADEPNEASALTAGDSQP